MSRQARVLASGFGFVEAPVVLDDGRVAFCDGTHGVVLAYENGSVRELARTGGGPNGLTLGAHGILYVAQFGPWAPDAEPAAPSIQRIESDGRVTTLLTHAGGVPLLAPNDLAFGPDGRLYLTDSGDTDHVRPQGPGRILTASANDAVVVLEVGRVFPNGIGFDSDGHLLWTESTTRRVCRVVDSAPETMAKLPPGHVPDGFAVASDGRLFVATSSSRGITVLSADGALLEHLDVGAEPTNCAFRGSSLVVTASTDSSGRPGTGALYELDTDAEPLPLRVGHLSIPQRA